MRQFTPDAINWPPNLREEWPNGYADGSTEPWVQQVVAALLVASHQRNVLELGAYKGFTSAWLCSTLQRMGGGEYLGVEINYNRQCTATKRLGDLKIPDVQWRVVQADALAALHSLPARSVGFAWVDDDHTPQHVAEELNVLYNPTMPEISKMVAGGLICMHDVCGGDKQLTPLKGVCIAAHGYALDFPRIGALGGIGVIKVPA